MVDCSLSYSKGLYNKVGEVEQWIRITEGCPNGCQYCRETKENGREPIYYPIPEIVRNSVRILDMNLMYKDDCIKILDDLGSRKVKGRVIHYELTCGIDYRYMTQAKADALYRNRFKNIRFAWDWSYKLQGQIRECVLILMKAGYKANLLSCFMLCNWKIPYTECEKKLDLLKVWNVKVNDCYYDNQVFPNVKPVFWKKEELIDFRRRCRKHNQLVRFGLDPEEQILSLSQRSIIDKYPPQTEPSKSEGVAK